MFKKLCLVGLVLFANILAMAQAPSTVTITELNDDNLPDLGAQVNWTSVSGATYNVYRYANNGNETCLSTHGGWVEVVEDLSVLTYSDYPASDQYGWGGDWCYGVSATVNNVESAIAPAVKPAIFGIGYYFDWAYYTYDCSTFVGYPTGDGTFTLTRVRNGTPENMPAQLVTSNNPHRWAGHFRVLSTDYVYGTFTLPPDILNPQGKVFSFPNMFLGEGTDGSPVQANWGPYLTFQVNEGTDGRCQFSHYGFFQPARNN